MLRSVIFLNHLLKNEAIAMCNNYVLWLIGSGCEICRRALTLQNIVTNYKKSFCKKHVLTARWCFVDRF